MKKRTFPCAVAYAGCALIALTTVALAQTSDPKDVTVQVRHDSKDSKAIPLTQEKEPLVQFLLEAGYTSEYNFRGTNLMPGSEGGFFYQALATIPKVGPGSLTFGVWAIHQIGEASAPTWSVSEGGGGSGVVGQIVPVFDPAGNFLGEVTSSLFPTTTQTTFREWDLIVSYKLPLGFVDVTFGNILFLINREATTSQVDVLPLDPRFPDLAWGYPPIMPRSRFANYNNVPTVGDEQFDRIYVRLSTDKIPHITPSIIYYQTIYSEGDQPTGRIVIDDLGRRRLVLQNVETGVPVFYAPLGEERNSELGGYLEARVNGNFPVGKWLDINPYGVIAYSFDDRTEPAAGTFGGRPLTGFNHAQAGLELAFHITDHIDFVTNLVYSHHISEAPIGTSENAFFGGVKVAVALW